MYKKILLTELMSRVWKVFRFFLLIGLSFVILYPLIYMLCLSFRAQKDLLDPSVVWISRNLTLQNFADAWRSMKYPSSFATTLLIGVGSSVLQTASCCLVGYGFARFRFRGRGVMFALVLLTIIVPAQVTLIPLYMLFKNFGLPFIGLWLENQLDIVMTVNLIDNPLLFYLQAMFGVGPMLVTVSLFSVVWYWTDVFNTSTFLGKSQTLAVALSFLRSNLAEEQGVINNVYDSTAQMQAGCLLFVIPLLILYVVMQRHFTEGVERSGIVG